MQKLVRGVPYILSVPPDSRYRPFWIPAIKITTWSPDTCYCTVNFWWDRRLPEDRVVASYCSSRDAFRLRPDKLLLLKGRLRHRERKGWRWVESHCEFHAGLRGEAWLRALIEENRARMTKKPTNDAQLVRLLARAKRSGV